MAHPAGVASTALPDRVALLGERRRALARVLGAEDRARDLALAVPTPRACGQSARRAHDALGRVERERAVARDRRGELPRAVDGPPGSATRLTMPELVPRAASIGSPVSASSMATWYGIRRGRWISAPPAATSERLTSGMPSRASRAATIRSQASATSKPPATAKPSTAAMSGLRGGALDDPGEAAALDPRALPRHERLEVHPRAERAPAPVRIADLQLVLRVEAVERRGDALGHREVDGVARVGPVEGDEQDAVGAPR